MSRKVTMNTYVIATAVIIVKNKLLIAKRAESKKFAPGKWEFISGFVDAKTPAESVILKEIKEELSSNAKVLGTSSSFEFTDNEARWVVVPFLVEIGDAGSVSLNTKDHSELVLIEAKQLDQYKDLKPFMINKGFKSLVNQGVKESR